MKKLATALLIITSLSFPAYSDTVYNSYYYDNATNGSTLNSTTTNTTSTSSSSTLTNTNTGTQTGVGFDPENSAGIYSTGNARRNYEDRRDRYAYSRIRDHRIDPADTRAELRKNYRELYQDRKAGNDAAVRADLSDIRQNKRDLNRSYSDLYNDYGNSEYPYRDANMGYRNGFNDGFATGASSSKGSAVIYNPRR